MEQDPKSVPFEDQVLTSDSDRELLLFEKPDDADAGAADGDVGTNSMQLSRTVLTRGLGGQKSEYLTEMERKKKVALKKEITPLSGISFVVNQIIGAGIFIAPSIVLSHTGSFGLSLVCWVVGAVVALAGALCYFEIGLLVRKSGGDYAILLEAYSFKRKNQWVEMIGSLVSFWYTWTSVIVLKSTSISIITLASARYLTRPFFIGCEVPEPVVKLLALMVIIILILVNSYSIKLTARVTTIFSGLKLLAIVFVVAVAIITVIIRQCFPEEIHRPFQPLKGHEPSSTSIALALYGVMWAYDGWSVMNYAIEEVKNVERTMPIALFVGVPLVALCYLSVNVAFFIVLSYEEILGATAVALPFGEATLGKAGLVVIPILVTFSSFGAANGSVYTASRSTFGAARDRLLPDFLSGIHTEYKTPVPALLFMGTLAVIMVVSGDITELVDAFAAASFLFYLLVFVGLIIMRFTHSDEPRIFKAYFIIPVALFSILVSIFLVLLPLFQEPKPTLLALGASLIGIPVYIFIVMETPRRLRPKIFDRLSRRVSWYVNNLLNTQSSRESTVLLSR